MTFPLTQLLTPKGRAVLFQELLDIAGALGLPTTSWQSGGVVRTILLATGQKLADQTLVSVEIAKSGFGDFVSVDLAPTWAKQTFDVDQIQAEPATGVVDLVNTEPTEYDLAPGELIVAHVTKGKTYRNIDPIAILASSTLTDVSIAADETGTGADAAPGTITVMVSNQVGVSVTNPAAVLGADLETRDALVTRGRSKLGALSPLGAKDAYNFIATTPRLADGTVISDTSTPITRTRVVANPLTGEVTVYLATADGAPIAGDVDIVQAAFDKWAEPWTVQATAAAATNHPIDITYQAWVKGSTLTASEIAVTIAGALAEFLKAVPLGGFLIPPDTGDVYVEGLDTTIKIATPGIVRVSVTAPAADEVLTPNEVPVLGVITATITIL